MVSLLRTYTWIVLCLFGFGLAATGASAQEDASGPISTERPTAGASPDVVPAGSLQSENGINLSLQRHAYVADLPENFWRYGLTNRVELRFQSANIVMDSLPDSIGHLLQTCDLAVSAKVLLGRPNTAAPRSAILTYSAPTGSVHQTSGSYDPSLTFIWTQAIRHGYFLNEVIGSTLTTLKGARRAAWAPSIAGGKALTGSITAFAEYAPTLLPGNNRVTVADGGLAFTRGRLAQFDIRSGYLKDAAGVHTLFSLGYSFRQDHFLSGILSDIGQVLHGGLK